MAPLRLVEPRLGNPGLHYTCVFFSIEIWSSAGPFINCHSRRFFTSSGRGIGYSFQLANRVSEKVGLSYIGLVLRVSKEYRYLSVCLILCMILSESTVLFSNRAVLRIFHMVCLVTV